jgi:hypothetical protein
MPGFPQGPARFIWTNHETTTSAVVQSVVLAGTNPNQFAITVDGCSGKTVPPGQTCIVQAQFAAMLGGTGTQTATLTVKSSIGTDTTQLQGELP